MIEILNEENPQKWRALAILNNGEESLICLGLSITQVKENYPKTWQEIFDQESVRDTKEIKIQRWVGMPSCGYWRTQITLPAARLTAS